MEIISREVGFIGTNCYIAFNEQTLEGVVVDPGGDAPDILTLIRRKGLKIVAILLTHGHGDHIMGLEEVRQATGAPVYIGEKDAQLLTDPVGNLLAYMGGAPCPAPAEYSLTDGEELDLAGLHFIIAATPGHTKGSVCIRCEDVVFCGDTVFAESVGRTDLPGGSYNQLLKSIKTKILPLPDATKLLPGHGPATSVGWEKRRNPFLQGEM